MTAFEQSFRMISKLLPALALLAPMVGTAADVAAGSVPTHLFAGEPRGPYSTGTFQTFWIDSNQDEVTTADPDDKRRITVQVWYPAQVRGTEPKAPYLLTPEQYLIETLPADHNITAPGRIKSWKRQLDHAYALLHVRTNSVRDAPVAPGTERFPVLIYSHGSRTPHFIATFHTEFLASHGYVVVAVSHPGINGIFRQRYPDGYVYNFWQVDTGDERDRSEEPNRDEMELAWSGAYEVAKEMARNVSFVLDRLAALDQDRKYRLHGRLDLQRVGVMGWSMGGAASLQASLVDPRIKAAINDDGWPYGLTGAEGVVTKGANKPVMVMTGGWPVAPDQRPKDTRAGVHEVETAAELHFWSMFRRSTDRWYWLRVANANHGHFSDNPLFEPDPTAADPDQIHPRAAHAIINHYTLEFFDRHLYGRDKATLLSGEKRYHDAVLFTDGDNHSDGKQD